MSTRRTLYLHTVDGQPGGWDGDQIYVAHVLPHWQDRPAPALVTHDLDAIKRRIEKSTAFRKRHGWDVPVYGWCVVKALA